MIAPVGVRFGVRQVNEKTGIIVLDTDCPLSPTEFDEDTVYVYGLPLITCVSV
jgi:hypothetical protein